MTRYEGTQLRPWLYPKVRPSDLARAAGCSSQYVSEVLAGRKPASPRIVEAARELGLPVEVIWPSAERERVVA